MDLPKLHTQREKERATVKDRLLCTQGLAFFSPCTCFKHYRSLLLITFLLLTTASTENTRSPKLQIHTATRLVVTAHAWWRRGPRLESLHVKHIVHYMSCQARGGKQQSLILHSAPAVESGVWFRTGPRTAALSYLLWRKWATTRSSRGEKKRETTGPALGSEIIQHSVLARRLNSSTFDELFIAAVWLDKPDTVS